MCVGSSQAAGQGDAFGINTTLPHPGVQVHMEGSLQVAIKENYGWVTLRATRSLSPGNPSLSLSACVL
jgi:hypothetical protein